MGDHAGVGGTFFFRDAPRRMRPLLLNRQGPTPSGGLSEDPARTPKTRKLPGFIQASLSPIVVPDGGGLKLNGVF
ncbi:hypothetical protein D7V97_21865 [Corallococcus sp. CA053C]|uniref:hypothetical protein n=1 Tax=Corallococcus sp. CA053C TaxID=2316732 RepID=UPI000EA2F781|nr:hypothetical protein [Corallococcus sp. CA053C]RKH07008.1 hypothetical protein D7V97_21865 [Corallococcus sp. CA053C]